MPIGDDKVTNSTKLFCPWYHSRRTVRRFKVSFIVSFNREGTHIMAKNRTGYIFKDKQGRWYARTTITDATGKRRNIKRQASDKREAKQILKEILRRLDDEGSK